MPDEFPETRWSLVLRLRSADEDEAAAACAEICRNYWVPLYQFLRLQGDSREEAEDVVQGFFLKVLEKGWLRSVEPFSASEDGAATQNRGRLRSYLLACLRAYRAKQYRHDQAVKRGGGLDRVFGDFSDAESGIASIAGAELGPDEQFDRAWAVTLIKRASQRLRDRYSKKGRGDLYDALEPLLSGDQRGSIQSLSRSLNVDENTLRSDLHRLRKRLRDCICAEVSETLDPVSGITADEELTALMRALG